MSLPVELNSFTANAGDGFALHSNYPNPFNPETTIRFYVPTHNGELKNIKLNIYNSTGQLVSTLYEGQITGGQYEMKWNGTNSAGKARGLKALYLHLLFFIVVLPFSYNMLYIGCYIIHT